MSRKPSISLPNGVSHSSESLSAGTHPLVPDLTGIEGPSKRQRLDHNGESLRSQVPGEIPLREGRSERTKTLTKKNIAEFNRENQRVSGQAMDQRSKNKRTQQFLNPRRRRSSDSPDSEGGTLSSSGEELADQLVSVITRAYQASVKRRDKQTAKRAQQSISDAHQAAGAKKKPSKNQGQQQAKYSSLIKLNQFR